MIIVAQTYIGHCPIKVNVTVGPIFLLFTGIQTVRSNNLNLVQARKLILSMYVHLIIMIKIYEYHYA